jgi:hypothetical protein
MTSQSQLTMSAPLWGFARRHHLGGPALIAFVLTLWALFLGTVGAPLDPSAVAARAAAAADAAGAVATSR